MLIGGITAAALAKQAGTLPDSFRVRAMVLLLGWAVDSLAFRVRRSDRLIQDQPAGLSEE